MEFKNIIVWAGLSGITIAQILAERGQESLIIEKRNHIWWNCYDYFDENGILIHKYWPHIFHTDLEDVWNYVNRFSNFTNYQHEVIWLVDGNLIPIPFNLNSIYSSFSHKLAKEIEEKLLEHFEYNSKVSINELREKAKQTWQKQLQFLADYIFEKVFKNYTLKQWWISADEINPQVLKRVPVVISKDNRYFPHNKYQWMPTLWYTKMLEKMLDSPKNKILLNTNYKEVINNITYENLYITWPIDEYYDYKYWKLEYRKTLYQMETYNSSSYQQKAVINYPNDYEYTRITEFKKFYPNNPSTKVESTVICKEIPWIGNIDAYPIENDKNLEILWKYNELANQDKNIHFFWRLANYKYYDMDKTIKNILDYYK